MSYLDVPRLHVAGSFYADQSTMNNDPKHYDPKVKQASPWQEPMGRHDFRIVDCAVVSALEPDGTLILADDPIIGAPIQSTDLPTPAKIVDLDVYQQAVPTIFGLSIALDVVDGIKITGILEPATLNSFFPTAVLPDRSWDEYGGGSPGADSYGSGFFKTVMRVSSANWPAAAQSPMLRHLRAATTVAGDDIVLSFRFVLDAYINNTDAAVLAEGATRDPSIMYRRFGRLIGAIGPWHAGEPAQAPGPRWLQPRAKPKDAQWFVPAFNGAPFKLLESPNLLAIDLANALSRAEIGGGLVDLGMLTASVGTGPSSKIIGMVPYDAAFGTTAGICTIPIEPGDWLALQTQPLTLSTSRTDIGAPEILSEDPGGVFIATERRASRMTSEPGSAYRTLTVPAHATHFGRPMAGTQLRVHVEPVHGNTPGATVPPANPGDTPSAVGALGASIGPVDATGVATITLTALKDPGSRTPELDGQVYFVFPYLAGGTPWKTPVQECQASVLLWSSYPENKNPRWSDICALMAPYDKLYPYMRNLIALADQNSFTTFMNNPPWFPVFTKDPGYSVQGVARGAIPWYLTREITDPSYMPVTRDLSPNKIKTLLWYVFNNPVLPTPPPPAAPSVKRT